MRAKSEGLTAMKPENVGTVNHGQRPCFVYALIPAA